MVAQHLKHFARPRQACGIGAPGHAYGSGCPRVAPDASIELLMPLLLETERPVLVANGAPQPLGYIDRAHVLQALLTQE